MRLLCLLRLARQNLNPVDWWRYANHSRRACRNDPEDSRLLDLRSDVYLATIRATLSSRIILGDELPNHCCRNNLG